MKTLEVINYVKAAPPNQINYRTNCSTVRDSVVDDDEHVNKELRTFGQVYEVIHSWSINCVVNLLVSHCSESLSVSTTFILD